jgi:L-lactate utilization protein LutB
LTGNIKTRALLRAKTQKRQGNHFQERPIMSETLDKYWALRLNSCRQALEKNNFQAFIAADPAHAGEIVRDQILPGLAVKTVSWGYSMTLNATGVLEYFKHNPDFDLIETFDDRVPRWQIMERRRQALLADLFFTGSNAVTETGALVNLDMIGNRVAGITFGPKYVVITIGRNKIVPDLELAMERVKNVAAPMNAIRHALKTPCVKTAHCLDCKSPQRICNAWVITEKSYPKGRIKVILINKDLGL